MASNEKFAEALHLLDEAARDKKDELKTLLVDKYAHLKEALAETDASLRVRLQAAREKAAERLQHAKDVGVDKVAEAAKSVDAHAHKNPWPYVGGAALAGLLLGVILGMKSSDR